VFRVDLNGDMSIDCSGNDLNLASTDTIRVLNTTDSGTTSTGALVVSGGIGCAKEIKCVGLTNSGALNANGALYANNNIWSTRTAEQLRLRYDASNYTSFTVDSGGDLTIDCTGNDLNLASTDTVHILNTTNATDTLTGSLIVSGGFGIAKDLYIGGITRISDTTTAVSFSTGALSVVGGISTNTNIFAPKAILSDNATQLSLRYNTSNKADFLVDSTGDMTIDCSGNDLNLASTDTVHVLNTANASSTSTGSFITAGGVGIAKDLYVGGNIYGTYTGSISISSTDDSTSTSTGSLIVPGGAGIAKAVNIGGITKIWDTTQSANTTTGALLVAGGAGIAKTLYVGGSVRCNSNIYGTSGIYTAITGPQTKLMYDVSNLCSFTVNDAGSLTIDAEGTIPKITFADPVYTGGLFEWLLLQDIYGTQEFLTTKKELDLLKFKPNKILNISLLEY
jgi:enhancing lycopene biosynthesis protein 2